VVNYPPDVLYIEVPECLDEDACVMFTAPQDYDPRVFRYQLSPDATPDKPVTGEIEGQLEADLLARISELEHSLNLILPMAKGYAHKNPVGRNLEIVEHAEKAARQTLGSE
jgi:hypothetical protein